MPFCRNCGKELSDDARFCSFCGTNVNGQQAFSGNAAAPQVQAFAPDAAGNKGMSALAYLGILLIIPLFAAKDSAFVRFHTKQGAYLFLLGIAAFIISAVLGTFKTTIILYGIPYETTPGYVSAIRFVMWAVMLVLTLIGIANAAKGVEKELPFIGNLNFLNPVLKKINPQM